MSVHYYMVSEKEAIWVAQEGLSGFTSYYGDEKCMQEFRLFLERNMGKALQFLDEHTVDNYIENGKVIEIEWSK